MLNDKTPSEKPKDGHFHELKKCAPNRNIGRQDWWVVVGCVFQPAEFAASLFYSYEEWAVKKIFLYLVLHLIEVVSGPEMGYFFLGWEQDCFLKFN